jgi:hypothetical protein
MLGLMLRRVMSSRVVLVVYVVVGLLVANSHHYFAHLMASSRSGRRCSLFSFGHSSS